MGVVAGKFNLSPEIGDNGGGSVVVVFTGDYLKSTKIMKLRLNIGKKTRETERGEKTHVIEGLLSSENGENHRKLKALKQSMVSSGLCWCTMSEKH